MKKWDEDSRTYDPKELKTEEDKRFIRAKKEMIQIHVQYFIFVLIEFIAAFSIYKFYPDTYVFGFPFWFVTGVMIAFLFWLFTIHFLIHGITDCSLSARQEGDYNERD